MLKKRNMFFSRTNIEKELVKHKSKADRDRFDTPLEMVYHILSDVSENHSRIKNNLSGSKRNENSNNFDLDLLETDKIFHLEHIKQICIDYRLRFLDSKYFKGDIPEEALAKINEIEKKHNIEMQGFKIIAPSKLFKLKDKDDPLLFAPIGNGYFYLIHKWGNDLHPLRKLLMWPFKDIVNLTLLVFLMSYVFTIMIPEGLLSKSNTNGEFWVMFFFMFKSVAAVVIFYGFGLGKNFSPAIWNSKYFKA